MLHGPAHPASLASAAALAGGGHPQPLVVTLNCLEDPSLEQDALSGAAAVEHAPLSALSAGRVEAAAAVLLPSLAFLPRAAQRRLRPWQLLLCLGSPDRAADAAAAAELGLRLVHVDANRAEEVADTVMALFLGLLRRTHLLSRHASSSSSPAAGWLGSVQPLCRGMRRCRGLVLGIVGVNAAARCLATRSLAFRMSVLYFDPLYEATGKVKRPSIVFPSAARRMDTLNDLLAASDLVSLHCALTNDTTHILNAERLQHIKPGAFIVNTGSCQLIDDCALKQLLIDGTIAGCALDGAEGPQWMEAWVREMPNVLILPRSADYSEEVWMEIREKAIAILQSFLYDGVVPNNVISDEDEEISEVGCEDDQLGKQEKEHALQVGDGEQHTEESQLTTDYDKNKPKPSSPTAMAAATEKTAEDIRRELQELQRQHREITERLRDPRGLRRGVPGAGPVPGGPRPLRGFVRPAVVAESGDQPAQKRRLLSAVVKVDGAETNEEGEKAAEAEGREEGSGAAEAGDRRGVSNGGFRRDGGLRMPRRVDYNSLPEPAPRELPKNDDPNMVRRNKRMLGQLLVGTLEKFQQEDKKLSNSEAFLRRSETQRKAEQKVREESERLRQQEREQIAEKRKRDMMLRARVAAKAEEKRLELLYMQWTEHHKKLSNFLRTKAEPPIYYMPAKPIIDDPIIVEQNKEKVFEEWKSVRRAELTQFQKQVEEQYLSNVERQLERIQNARNARRANGPANMQEMDKELDTHRAEHGPKTRRVPEEGGGNDEDEDVEDMAAEDELMDEVLGINEDPSKPSEEAATDGGEPHAPEEAQ